MAEPRRRTFRVRNIPNYIKEQNAARLIKDILAYEGPTEDVHVHSLAPDVESYERPPTKVATVTFTNHPLVLNANKKEWSFSKERLHLSHDVIVDTHFLSFTVLKNVTTHEHISDCFAISGLASHPFGSWKARVDDSDFMWLRDILPIRYPGLRCIIYGYDTHLPNSHSFKDIEDISRALTVSLKLIGSGLPASKPTIFIAHSLGGIVLKEALMQMARGNDIEMHLLLQIKKTVLFGVPNRGMRISHLIPMVEGQPNKPFVYRLSENSGYLADLDKRYSNISYLRNMRVVSIYETRESQIPEEITPGCWKRAGSYATLVSKESSIHCRSEEQDTYPVDRDHSNLVKYTGGDHDLNVILDFLDPNVPNVGGSILGPRREMMSFEAQARSNRVPSLYSDGPYKHEKWQALATSLRESLYSEQTFERYGRVDAAHADTFNWVFDSRTTSINPWFVNNSSLFWINGKPGSGKSTMMKYIWTHRDNFRKISQDQSVDACFFFSHRGSYIQKSFEGLLYCVLYQLCQNDTLAHSLIPLQAAVSAGEQLRWNADTLEDALFRVLQQRLRVINVFLLLDALDEFDGNPKRVALLLLRCVEEAKKGSINLKLCFSCRPWNVFNDSFARTPQLRVEDHTEADIARYVGAEMTDCEAAFSMLEPTEPEYSVGVKLQSQILKRAQGVFLWVRLVLDKLLSELTEGATPEDLENILETLPSALEELYDTLVKRINPEYRREGYIMLEIVLRAEHPVTLSELRDATRCVLKGLEQVRGHSCSHPEAFQNDRDIMCRRVRSRCGGLLEIVQATDHDLTTSPYSSVQLMHQTVQEFLLQPETWQNFIRLADGLVPLNGFSFLSQYYLTVLSQSADLKPWKTHKRHMIFLWRGMHYACKAELLSGKSQLRLLNAISDDSFSGFVKDCHRQSQVRVTSAATNVGRMFPNERDSLSLEYISYPRPYPVDSRLSFAVVADLRLYMRDFIARDKPDPYILGQLLHYIVERQNGVESYQKMHKIQLGEKMLGVSSATEMTRLLLNAKADCTAKNRGMTPFGAQFTAGCYFNNGRRLLCRKVFVNILLFGHPGVDPNADVNIPLPHVSGRIRGADLLVCKPLHVASGSLDRHLIERLLIEGANVNGLDNCGHTPLDYIESDCASPANSLQDQSVCAQFLIEHGAYLTKQLVQHQVETRTRLYREMNLLAPISTDQVSQPVIPRPVDTRPVDSQSGVISVRSLQHLRLRSLFKAANQIVEISKGKGPRRRKGRSVVESDVTIQSSSAE